MHHLERVFWNASLLLHRSWCSCDAPGCTPSGPELIWPRTGWMTREVAQLSKLVSDSWLVAQLDGAWLEPGWSCSSFHSTSWSPFYFLLPEPNGSQHTHQVTNVSLLNGFTMLSVFVTHLWGICAKPLLMAVKASPKHRLWVTCWLCSSYSLFWVIH